MRYELNTNVIFRRNTTHEKVYKILKNKTTMSDFEIFSYIVLVGLSFDKMESFTNINVDANKTLQTRGHVIKNRTLLGIYASLLEKDEFKYNIEKLANEDFIKGEFVKTVEEYAEGGMQLLLEEFKDAWRWDGDSISEEYDDYDVDLLRFIYDRVNSVEF